MRRIKLLLKNTSENLIYEEFLKNKFSKIKDSCGVADFHIVIEENNELVAGASLARFNKISSDPDVTHHWHVLQENGGIRILRLWTHRSALVPQLINAIRVQLRDDDFVYGIISIPLQYARKHELIFSLHENRLTPRISVTSCSWDNTSDSTSDGQRLISLYRSLNAKFLGPLAASPCEQTVRAVMGLDMQNFELTHFLSRHENTVN